MVFWIGIGVVAAFLLWGVARGFYMAGNYQGFDIEETWPAAFSLLAAFLFLIVIVLGVSHEAKAAGHPVMSHRYGLHALVTKDNTESSLSGGFFLGFGGVEGSSSTTTRIVYIRIAKDGGSTIHDTTVGRSVVYEDVEPGGKPYLEDWVSQGHTDTIWVPWTWAYTIQGEAQHRFHIPKGSILSNYDVNP